MSDPTFLKLNIPGFGIPALDSRMAAIEKAECPLWVEKTHSPITKADTRRHPVANGGKATSNGRMFLIGHRRLRPNFSHPNYQSMRCFSSVSR